MGASYATQPEVFLVGVEQAALWPSIHGGHLHPHSYQLQPRLSLHSRYLCLASVPLAVLDSTAFGHSEEDTWPYLSVLESPPAPNCLHLVLLAPTPKSSQDPSPHT